jgi:hypothetical protein
MYVKETLDMDEMEKNINNILDVCPQEMTVPDMCAVIANMVNLYKLTPVWPLIVAQTTALLEKHEIIEEAVEDATDFLNKAIKNSMH